ncbi:MAG: hypothetical protein WCA06_03275 [Terrimicrobiaceae bacterium]
MARSYLDVDPGFTQLWVDVCNSDVNSEGHDVFLAVGTTFNLPGALLPTLDREWIVFPPVVADYWRQKLAIPNVAARRPMDHDLALVRLPRTALARPPIRREARESRGNEVSSATLALAVRDRHRH